MTKRPLFLLILTALLGLQAHAQVPAGVLEAADQDARVLDVSEQMPQFPGGAEGLVKFIADNVRYPQASVQAKTQGTVVVQFVVGADGQPRDARVLRGVDPVLDAEALRVARALPAFTPGRDKDGEAVAVRYVLPVQFKL